MNEHGHGGYAKPPGNRKLILEILNIVKSLAKGQCEIMSKVEDVKAVLDSIGPVIDAIAADSAKLVADLKACVDAGSASEAQLQELFDSASAIKSRLEAVDASVPAPTV